MMTEILAQYLEKTLPEIQRHDIKSQLVDLETGNFEKLLSSPLSRRLFSHETERSLGLLTTDFPTWTDHIETGLRKVLSEDKTPDSSIAAQVFIIGLASLGAFLQSNVTGPPLPFSVGKTLFAPSSDNSQIRQRLLESLAIDGESPYNLAPHIELFCLARVVFQNVEIISQVQAARWANIRVKFLHQRLLSENAPTLEYQITNDIELFQRQILSIDESIPNLLVSLLLEIASIHLYYGKEKPAQLALAEATKARDFRFALTGLLGKRTKFQQHDISQLVVLAKSAESPYNNGTFVKPVNVDLNDDTILDGVSFSKTEPQDIGIQNEQSIPSELKNLDPENQPQLHPLDAIILLTTASSITNTSPADGLTREETLPYATRVLEGGSSNWQIYTQALLTRSRIEGYKSRTVERGLLQLQALVDQVIIDTTQTSQPMGDAATTFLPRAKEGESAPVHQRLLYVYQLASPTRWELEAELAARWISLGGLKSALEIYERLQMWPEVALCWAGIERDDKARQVVKKQLFDLYDSTQASQYESEPGSNHGPERQPLPPDAPRLYCILGDLDKNPAMYERAWEISNATYFRAQRSLARYWYGQNEYEKSVLAFSKAVKVKQLDHATWFAMGCALLELSHFSRAAEVFSRCVQIDDQDAESWSNLAVALLGKKGDVEEKISVNDLPRSEALDSIKDEHAEPAQPMTSYRQRNKKDALTALKHAARLKRESYKIWDNILTVASSLDPPSYSDMMIAQKRVIELRGSVDGEKCVDANVISMLVKHVTSAEKPQAADSSTVRMIFQLVEQCVVPLITSSSRLWQLVAQLAEWRDKPDSALNAYEKAWRAITVQPGWEHGTQFQWNQVVNATVQLAEAYRHLGQKEKTEGMAAGSGELVRKDWKFKARSAVRGILGRAKDAWEGSDGWERLSELMKTL